MTAKIFELRKWVGQTDRGDPASVAEAAYHKGRNQILIAEQCATTENQSGAVHAMGMALDEFTMAAKGGNSDALDALYELADYSLRDRCSVDIGKNALRVLANDLAQPKGQFLYGMLLLNGHLPDRPEDTFTTTKDEQQFGRQMLKLSADNGYAAAHRELGLMALRTITTKRTPLNATLNSMAQDAAQNVKHHLGSAAALGDADAAMTLGVVLCQGRYLPRDIKRGKEMLKQATVLGSTDAHIWLGQAHQAGAPGFRQSNSMALCHFQQAVTKGDPYGLLLAVDLYCDMGKPQLAKDALLAAFDEATRSNDQSFIADCRRTLAESRQFGHAPKESDIFQLIK